MVNAGEDFDPLNSTGSESAPRPGKPSETSVDSAQVEALHAKASAFRDLADRFYILWWNLPKMSTRDVDRDLKDMFRMYMDLAPSMGVSRNAIPELRECCGRKRDWGSDPLAGDPSETIKGVLSPFSSAGQQKLGFGLGDLVHRVARLFTKKDCQACEMRRRRLNSAFPARYLVGIIAALAISVAAGVAAYVAAKRQ